jgi:TolB protein
MLRLILALVAAHAAASGASSERIAISVATGTGADGSGGMVVIDASGRRVRTLTKRRAGREDIEPAWSPDGRRLAFARSTDRGRSFRVYVMNAGGSGVRRLTRGTFDYSPAWSPDGRWIAYRSNAKLRIVHPDGTGGHTVASPKPTDVMYPQWAPGGRISYSYWATIRSDWPAACEQPGRHCGEVVSAKLDGSARRAVVRGRDAHWAPGGSAIVYTGSDGGVFTAPGSGGGGHRLGRGYRAEWSRDGSRIVYARMGDMPSQDSIWVMNRDGGNAHRIFHGGSFPSWRP